MTLSALPLQARNVQVSHREKWQIRTYINGNLINAGFMAIFRRHGNAGVREFVPRLERVLVRGSSTMTSLCAGADAAVF